MKVFKVFLRIIGVLLIIILIFFLKEFFKDKSEAAIDKLTGIENADKNEINNFKTFKIGNTDFFINSPYKIIETSTNTSYEQDKSLDVLRIFTFKKNKFFEGTILYMKRKIGVGYDIDAGADGVINNFNNLPGVEKVIDNRKIFNNDELTGYYIDGIMMRYGKSVIFKCIISKCKQENISINLLTTDPQNEALLDEIISSIIKLYNKKI